MAYNKEGGRSKSNVGGSGVTFKRRRQVIEIAIGAKSDAAPERFTCARNTGVERPAKRKAKYSLPSPSGPHCVRGMSLETKLLREGEKRRNLRPLAVGFNKHDRHRSTLLPKRRRRRRRFSFQAIGGSEARGPTYFCPLLGCASVQ